jgi:hypothetical protein
MDRFRTATAKEETSASAVCEKRWGWDVDYLLEWGGTKVRQMATMLTLSMVAGDSHDQTGIERKKLNSYSVVVLDGFASFADVMKVRGDVQVDVRKLAPFQSFARHDVTDAIQLLKLSRALFKYLPPVPLTLHSNSSKWPTLQTEPKKLRKRMQSASRFWLKMQSNPAHISTRLRYITSYFAFSLLE